jgi:hypothetical protein
MHKIGPRSPSSRRTSPAAASWRCTWFRTPTSGWTSSTTFPSTSLPTTRPASGRRMPQLFLSKLW